MEPNTSNRRSYTLLVPASAGRESPILPPRVRRGSCAGSVLRRGVITPRSHTSSVIPPPSHLLAHTSSLTPPPSHPSLTPSRSHLLPHTTSLTPPASHHFPHTSCLTPPRSHLRHGIFRLSATCYWPRVQSGGRVVAGDADADVDVAYDSGRGQAGLRQLPIALSLRLR